jgi:hypothetical protein
MTKKKFLLVPLEQLRPLFSTENGIDNRPIEETEDMIDCFPMQYDDQDFLLVAEPLFIEMRRQLTDMRIPYQIAGYYPKSVDPAKFSGATLASEETRKKLIKCCFSYHEETPQSLAEKLIDPGYCACKGECNNCKNKPMAEQEIDKFIEDSILTIMTITGKKSLTKDEQELLKLFYSILPIRWQDKYNRKVTDLLEALKGVQ